MLELLNAIITELQNSSTLNYISDNNIMITEIENYIPEIAKFPCITLKDNGSINDEQISKKYYQTLKVSITIFNRIHKLSDSILNPVNGILKIEEDVISTLKDNRLDICSLLGAFPITQEPTRNLKIEKDSISYKKIIMEYKFFK